MGAKKELRKISILLQPLLHFIYLREQGQSALHQLLPGLIIRCAGKEDLALIHMASVHKVLGVNIDPGFILYDLPEHLKGSGGFRVILIFVKGAVFVLLYRVQDIANEEILMLLHGGRQDIAVPIDKHGGGYGA